MTPQCPNCRQYKVSTTPVFIDPETGRAVMTQEEAARRVVTPTVVTLWGITFLILIVAMCVDFNTFPQPATYNIVSFISSGVVFVAGAVLCIRNGRTVERERKAALLRARRQVHHFCNNCYYEWTI